MLRTAPAAPDHPQCGQEAVVVALRETLLLPLDDLLAVTYEFVHPRSRARVWIVVCAATGFLTSRR